MKTASVLTKLQKQRDKIAAKVAERDERIAKARRSADYDRKDVSAVSQELVALYSDPDALLKHVRVVDMDEVEENEFNLNVPRYVDTFEPGATDGCEESAERAPSCERRRGASREGTCRTAEVCGL